MNRFVRLIKENVVPFIVFMVIAVSCCGAWFFFHPSSPYHDRYSFVVSFQAVGTLSPGNLVAIQGIPCGEITKVELTDDARADMKRIQQMYEDMHLVGKHPDQYVTH